MKVLFDTGESGVLLDNADMMGSIFTITKNSCGIYFRTA